MVACSVTTVEIPAFRNRRRESIHRTGREQAEIELNGYNLAARIADLPHEFIDLTSREIAPTRRPAAGHIWLILAHGIGYTICKYGKVAFGRQALAQESGIFGNATTGVPCGNES